MSKLSTPILLIVIMAIIVAMYFEVPYLSGNVGALIVIALVYAFVVAKREVALLSHAIEEQREEQRRKQQAPSAEHAATMKKAKQPVL